VAALQGYDGLGPEQFSSQHGYGPSRSHALIWNKRHYQPGPCPHDQHRTDGYPHAQLIATLVETAADQILMMCAALAVSLARPASAAAR
jgi:hypothetical protein